MNYEDWEREVPEPITGDVLWKMKVYRSVLFATNLGWHDITKLAQDRRTVALSDQLYRSLGSISANIAEGYSRSSNKDRSRFYEYALGSARESRDWYYKGSHILSESVISHRLNLMTEIIRLLLVMIPSQRKPDLREETEVYTVDAADIESHSLV
jgi:four helix bundle protein